MTEPSPPRIIQLRHMNDPEFGAENSGVLGVGSVHCFSFQTHLFVINTGNSPAQHA